MRLFTAVALGLCTTAGSVRAQDPNSAAAIAPGCRAYLSGSQADQAGQGICLGRIAVLRANLDLADACPPDNVTIADAIRVILAYFDSMPQRSGEGFGRLGAEALAARWPCTRR